MTVCAAATSSAVRAGEARPSRNAVSRTSARMIGGSLFARSSYAAILRRLYRETPAIDRLDRVGNTRLQCAAPGDVQRRFDPDLAHRGISFCFLFGNPCGASDNP